MNKWLLCAFLLLRSYLPFSEQRKICSTSFPSSTLVKYFNRTGFFFVRRFAEVWAQDPDKICVRLFFRLLFLFRKSTSLTLPSYSNCCSINVYLTLKRARNAKRIHTTECIVQVIWIFAPAVWLVLDQHRLLAWEVECNYASVMLRIWLSNT